METLFKTVVGISGAAASYFFGGWSSLLGVLLFVVVADYITGIGASAFEGKLSSKVGMKGIAKKVFIFVIVAMSHLVDTVLGDGHLFRDATIFFYLANEVLSIIEYGGRMGAPIPPGIKKAVEALRSKGE
jgi:toxin secretion/phage lysis holin